MTHDEELLLSGDPEDFGRFYDRYVEIAAGLLRSAARTIPRSRPTSRPRRSRPRWSRAGASGRGRRPRSAWLFGIAQHKLVDYHRRGSPRTGCGARLGIERVAGRRRGRRADQRGWAAEVALQLVERAAGRAARGGPRARPRGPRLRRHRGRRRHLSEATVRKRVSRGLGALREPDGGAAMSDYVPHASASELVDAAEREQGGARASRSPRPRSVGRRRGGGAGGDRRLGRRGAEHARRPTNDAAPTP